MMKSTKSRYVSHLSYVSHMCHIGFENPSNKQFFLDTFLMKRL